MIDSALLQLLTHINKERIRSESLDPTLEEPLEKAHQPSCKLAVYGTLAPGESNYPVVQPIGGEWTPVEIEGDRFIVPEGPVRGFPGFQWKHGGSRHRALLLHAKDLPLHWPRLDDFEGPAYARILIPVFLSPTRFTIANVYQAL